MRTIDEAGVIVTVNDQGTAGQADVSEAMVAAGIPRIAGNVAPQDWGDPNAYPLDASGTGVTFLLPQALIDSDSTRSQRSGSTWPRPRPSSASSRTSTKVSDLPRRHPGAGGHHRLQPVHPRAPRTSGATGATLAVGEQEAVQIVKAGQQLGSDLKLGSSLGTFSHNNIADLGDFAEQMVFVWSFAPPTADLPVYDALRADLAASGEETLQPENLKASPMRSWIGLYALLKMIRDAKMTEFTRDGITHHARRGEGRADARHVRRRELDAEREPPRPLQACRHQPLGDLPVGSRRRGARFDGNFVESSTISFDEVLCGSPFGAPAESLLRRPARRASDASS